MRTILRNALGAIVAGAVMYSAGTYQSSQEYYFNRMEQVLAQSEKLMNTSLPDCSVLEGALPLDVNVDCLDSLLSYAESISDNNDERSELAKRFLNSNDIPNYGNTMLLRGGKPDSFLITDHSPDTHGLFLVDAKTGKIQVRVYNEPNGLSLAYTKDLEGGR